jgi:hypothetical protein
MCVNAVVQAEWKPQRTSAWRMLYRRIRPVLGTMEFERGRWRAVTKLGVLEVGD